MAQRRLSIIRPIAVAIVMAFTAEQAAFAAPALPTIMPTSLKPEVGFRLPESIAVVDDAYKAPGSSKLIVLIQDAHTNDSGQMNVAKALAEILPKEKISTVFTEADSGDKSLNYMKPFFSQEVRESVGRSLVRKGLLRGHDYANLVGKDFTLWGVEDPALYKETLEVYKDITLKRDKVRAYVDRVQRAANVIKGDVFSEEVRDLDAKRIQNAKGELSLADYAELLLQEAGRSGLSTAQYPHIKFLRRLRAIEKRVDFKKASAEEREAIKVLRQADRDELLAVHKNGLKATTEENGFYALFAEKLKGRESNFPDLARYFEYLKETRKMNALGVVGEVKGLEEDLFMRLSKTQDEAVLWTFARNLETLQNLISLKVSPEEYNRIKTQSSLYDIKLIAGFLNRKISDAGKHYENALTLESSYGAVWKDASDFYELTLKRDRVFFDRLTAKMSLDNVDKAVLITGGYHTPNLKAMLKSAGISYVSLLPQVLAETDTPRYERLLLAQLNDQNTGNTRIAVGSRPARQTAAMPMQMEGARLAEALTHEAAGNVPVAMVMAARPASDQGAVSGARMADLTPVLFEDQKQPLMVPAQSVVAHSEVLEIDGKKFKLEIDATPNNVATPTVVTVSDTSNTLRFAPVAVDGLVITPAKRDGAEEAFEIAMPNNISSFDVQVRGEGGKFMGVLRIQAEPQKPIVPGNQGPFVYTIGVDFVPGKLMTAVAARMAIAYPGLEVVEARLKKLVEDWLPRIPKTPQPDPNKEPALAAKEAQDKLDADKGGLAAYRPVPGHKYFGARPIAVQERITPEIRNKYLKETIQGLVPVFFMAGAAMRFAVMVANKAKGTLSLRNLIGLEPVFTTIVANNDPLVAEVNEALRAANAESTSEAAKSIVQAGTRNKDGKAADPVAAALLDRIKVASSAKYVSKIGEAEMTFNLDSLEAGEKNPILNYLKNVNIARKLMSQAGVIRSDFESKRSMGWTNDQIDHLLDFNLATLQFASYVYDLRKQAGERFELTASPEDRSNADKKKEFVDRFIFENGKAIVSINEETGEDVIRSLYENRFFGLNPSHVVFTVSPALPF